MAPVSMPELVFDTSVLVAGLRSKCRAYYQLLRLIDANLFRLPISVALALDNEDVLKRENLISNGYQTAGRCLFELPYS